MLHAELSFRLETMCEKVGIILMCIYFICIYLTLVDSFCFLGIINFLATLSVHVCAVALYKFVVHHKLTAHNFINLFYK
jgi:hypothetical protein